MMPDSNFGPLAQEITTSMLGALERNKAFEQIISGGRGAIIVDPMIRFGGRMILALGDVGPMVRGELEQ